MADTKSNVNAAALRHVMGWGEGIEGKEHCFDTDGKALCGTDDWAGGVLSGNPWSAMMCDDCGEIATQKLPWDRAKPMWRRQDEGQRVTVEFRGWYFDDIILLPPGVIATKDHNVTFPWPVARIMGDFWVVSFSRELSLCYVALGLAYDWLYGQQHINIRRGALKRRAAHKETPNATLQRAQRQLTGLLRKVGSDDRPDKAS